MNFNIKYIIVLLVVLSFCVSGCARQPSTSRSKSIIKSYMHKYGEKYPDTVFGKQPISEVDITGQREIRKHFVAIEAFITFKDGSVERIYATVERGPFGWRFVSWENAT